MNTCEIKYSISRKSKLPLTEHTKSTAIKEKKRGANGKKCDVCFPNNSASITYTRARMVLYCCCCVYIIYIRLVRYNTRRPELSRAIQTMFFVCLQFKIIQTLVFVSLRVFLKAPLFYYYTQISVVSNSIYSINLNAILFAWICIVFNNQIHIYAHCGAAVPDSLILVI